MFKKIIFLVLILLCSTLLFAQEVENSSEQEIYINSTEDLNPITGFPTIKDKPFVVFDYGVTTSWVNRVIFQEAYERSNFNFQDNLLGAYISMQTKNMQPLNSMIRVAGYYPLSFTFNNVPQVSKAVLRGAADLFAGILFELDMWNYLRITLSPGLHAYYQYSDRFHYVHLGAAGLANIELPIAKYWTIKIDGIASLDYPNLGSNKNIEIYDICWQYQIDLGFRYSKKSQNKYNYLKQEIY